MELQVYPVICVCRETSLMDHTPPDTLRLLWRFCCLHHPGLGCSSGPGGQRSLGAEVVTTTVLAPSVRAGDSSSAGSPPQARGSITVFCPRRQRAVGTHTPVTVPVSVFSPRNTAGVSELVCLLSGHLPHLYVTSKSVLVVIC